MFYILIPGTIPQVGRLPVMNYFIVLGGVLLIHAKLREELKMDKRQGQVCLESEPHLILNDQHS